MTVSSAPRRTEANNGNTRAQSQSQSQSQAVDGYTDASATRRRANKTNGVGTDTTVTAGQNKSSPKNWDNVASAVVQSTLPAWVNVGIMASLIFGGCCANVFALEAIVQDSPNSGALITFTQFFITFLLTVPSFLSPSAGPRALFLSERMIPLKSWLLYTAFFMSVNLLNNAVFAFKVSVPLHIIIRSGGPVASMVIGYLYNSKRYTGTQILAVSLLSIGVITAALADASAKGKSMDLSLQNADEFSTSMIGFGILGLAMVLAAFQGVYADRLYEKHGRNHWREALFYSHALSLPFLITSYPKLLPQLSELISSPSILASLPTASVPHASYLSTATATTTLLESLSPTTTSALNHSNSITQTAAALLHTTLPSHPLLKTFLARTPIKIVYLILNALTQYLCIRGVHLLSAKSSSLTVTVVLNIRKLVSLMLSVHLFGNVLSGGVMAGAAGVFLGGGIYAYEGARLRRVNDERRKKEKVG